MMSKDEFRRNSFSGVFSTERGHIQISEDYHGEGYHVETWDNVIGELQKVYLRSDEILALAKVGVIDNIFAVSQLADEVTEACDANEKREQKLEEIRRAYSDKHGLLDAHGTPGPVDHDTTDLSNGDGTPDYYTVEGWGVQKLDGVDFETYKV